MPLYDMDKSLYHWQPHKIEKWDVLKAAIKRFDVAAHVAATDQVLDELKPSVKSNLVWTKAGAIFGPNAESVDDINFIWQDVLRVWDEHLPLIYVGSLLMWRVSLRDEQWFTSADRTGKTDPLTGKEITQRSYWINEEFKVHFTAQDLVDKFRRTEQHP